MSSSQDSRYCSRDCLYVQNTRDNIRGSLESSRKLGMFIINSSSRVIAIQFPYYSNRKGKLNALLCSCMNLFEYEYSLFAILYIANIAVPELAGLSPRTKMV